jgi:hypothetical protein
MFYWKAMVARLVQPGKPNRRGRLSAVDLLVLTNEECHAAKVKQTCSCFEAQLKLVNFFIFQQNLSQHIVFNLVFNEDSKMGSAIFVPYES